MSYRFLLAIALSVVCFAPSPARAELSLGALRLKFEKAIETNGVEYEASSAKLREGYLGALERLKVSLGREGKLEQAAQVVTEIESMTANEGPKELPESADYRLKAMRTKWDRGQEKLDDGRKKRVAELAGVYMKVLSERKNGLTRAGEIRKALVVDGEIKRVREVEIVAEALANTERMGPLKGAYGDGNVALAKNGSKAEAPNNADKLIDGVVTNYQGGHTFSWGEIPCEMSVELPKVYVASKVRLLLWDLDRRRFRYRVEVSDDGENWSVIDDHGESAVSGGWKEIKFQPRDVRHVRVKGISNTLNKGFQVVELEVYSPKS